MFDKEIVIVAVGFLSAIIAAWIGARAAIKAGKYQAHAIIEAALVGRNPRADENQDPWSGLLEFVLVAIMVVLLAALVVLVTIKAGIVDGESLFDLWEQTTSRLPF